MYTLKEAAEACGRGKTAILKSIQKGRISAQKNPLGEWEIDPAELHRVYPPVPKAAVNESESEREGAASSAVEVAVMREKIASLELQLVREREFSQELSRRLDDEAAERRRLTALLTHQQPPSPAPPDGYAVTKPEGALATVATEGKGRLWEKLFGRKP